MVNSLKSFNSLSTILVARSKISLEQQLRENNFEGSRK